MNNAGKEIHLTSNQIGTILTALSARAEDMEKLSRECSANFAAFNALTPDQRAEYDKPKDKQHTQQADGTWVTTIDCTPHPRAYERMAAIFADCAKDAREIFAAINEAGSVHVLEDCESC